MNSNITLSDNSSNEGFLCDFVEASEEKPADGLNGDCIVSYGGEHSLCEMRVKLVNGTREGDAILLDDGVPFIRLEYSNGELSGVVEQMNDYGEVILRGHLVNGVENGLFEEMDEAGEVIWRGYYRSGKRYADWSDRIVCREGDLERGEFYELDESGRVCELSVYEKGVKSRVIARFDASTMTEYDSNGVRVYKGGFEGDVKNGIVRSGKGVEYSSQSKTAIYSGEWKDGKRHGKGTEYRDYKPVYIGQWREGEREERSEDDPSISIQPPSIITNPLQIEELVIESGFNESSGTTLEVRGLTRLKRMVIGENCFGSVRSFELGDLKLLESLVVGENSFTHSSNYSMIESSSRTDGTCRITNCPNLHSITLGDFVFADYHSFELDTLPSLLSMEMGESCFHWASVLSLKGRIVHCLIGRVFKSPVALIRETMLLLLSDRFI